VTARPPASVISIPALAIFLVASTAWSDPLTLPVVLPDGGRAVGKKETQRFNRNCRAERVWVEVEGTPNPEAENSINTQIRKKITVGHKLKKSDCDEEEHYTYLNRVEMTGVWRRFLGVQTTVCFPGGTGRCVESCDIFDLQTGKRGDLKQHLAPAGRASLEKQLNDQAQSDDFPSGYLPLKLQEAVMCLSKNGITVRFINDSGSDSTETLVSLAQLPQFFRLPPELANDVPEGR